ncbi:hypothetical protein J6590_007230 [Homalodisca vitripennis]|nr:hypothetical protein J6590_007230 [Homalodisca vitripennis]
MNPNREYFVFREISEEQVGHALNTISSNAVGPDGIHELRGLQVFIISPKKSENLQST